jgi:ribonuclease G
MPGELLVRRLAGRTWAALRESGTTVELRVERDGEPLPVGRIVKARVSRVLPGIQSAFLDVGLGRDAFLHGADLLLPHENLEVEAADGGPAVALGAAEDGDDADVPALAPPRRPAPKVPPIETRVSVGSEVLVQVIRESIGSKGARVTSYVSLPGRYVVYMPQLDYRGVSRRIADPDERARLKGILDALPAPSGGFIARTAGRDAPEDAYRADAASLVELWLDIAARASEAKAPAVLHGDVDLLVRLLREAPGQGFDRVVVDTEEAYARAKGYLEGQGGALDTRLVLHDGPGTLFEDHGVDRDIERALRPKVWLRSGGYVVLEQTEALVSIDVNSGKFLGRDDPEETALEINVEAAAEIARQLRLRDLGGIIVVDFIDMESRERWEKVLRALEGALAADRSRTKVVGLSELGLVQLTRKRTRLGLEAALTRPCPHCGGTGHARSPETVAAEALTEVRRLTRVFDTRSLVVRAHPDAARAILVALQSDALPAEVTVRVDADPTARADEFDVVAAGAASG